MASWTELALFLVLCAILGSWGQSRLLPQRLRLSRTFLRARAPLPPRSVEPGIAAPQDPQRAPRQPQRDDWPPSPDSDLLETLRPSLAFDRRSRLSVILRNRGLHRITELGMITVARIHARADTWGKALGGIVSSLPTATTSLARALRPGHHARRFVAYLLVGAFIASAVATGLAGITTVMMARSEASAALTALNRITLDLGLSGSHLPRQPITPTQLARAHADVTQAQQHLRVLRQIVTQPNNLIAIAANQSDIARLLHGGDALTAVALDATQMIDLLLDGGIGLINAIIDSPVLGGTGKGAVMTTEQYALLETGFIQSLPLLADIQTILRQTSRSDLLAPLNAKQRAQLQPILDLLPQAPTAIELATRFLSIAPALLGIGQPANLLLMTLDPSEMRPSGGFQGNYAIISIDGARPSSLTLRDIYLVDRPSNALCQSDNPQYQPLPAYSWWPYCPFGTRDANLSPDFPTSAQMTLDRFVQYHGNVLYDEKGTIVQNNLTMTGMIALQPAVIEQVLAVTGPIFIGDPYNETVTAANVQERIHYYQLTNEGRAKGEKAAPGDQISSANKRFTALIGRALLDHLKSATRAQMGQLAQMALADLHDKKIQVYFSDAHAEALLQDQGIAASLYRGDADALALNITNISGNKASTYLTLDLYDTIQLNADGVAYHHLTVVHHFNPPPIQDGTNTSEVYSVLYNGVSSQYNGLFLLAMERYYFARQSQYTGYPQVGFVDDPKRLFITDEPGRPMFGGLYRLTGDPSTHPVTWNNVPNTEISWTTPQAYTPGQTYSLHIDRQSGVNAQIHLTILQPSCSGNMAVATLDRPLTTDLDLSFATRACGTPIAP